MANNTAVHLLLVEDNARDGELTLRALRKSHQGDHVAWVTDGEEALAYVFGAFGDPRHTLRPPPKVILLDLKLPRVDGLEVLRQLKGDVRTRHIPVVVLTSSREEQDVVRTYQLGVNSYVVKPVDFEEFSDTVTKLGWYWLVLNQPPESVSAP
jgi:CheY-like chemotaxis protein